MCTAGRRLINRRMLAHASIPPQQAVRIGPGTGPCSAACGLWAPASRQRRLKQAQLPTCSTMQPDRLARRADEALNSETHTLQSMMMLDICLTSIGDFGLRRSATHDGTVVTLFPLLAATGLTGEDRLCLRNLTHGLHVVFPPLLDEFDVLRDIRRLLTCRRAVLLTPATAEHESCLLGLLLVPRQMHACTNRVITTLQSTRTPVYPVVPGPLESMASARLETNQLVHFPYTLLSAVARSLRHLHNDAWCFKLLSLAPRSRALQQPTSICKPSVGIMSVAPIGTAGMRIEPEVQMQQVRNRTCT